MSGKKSRKQPLTCLPDLDDTANVATIQEEKLTVILPNKKKMTGFNGKENVKKRLEGSPSCRGSTEKKNHQPTPNGNASDSDSDLDDVWSSLKKSGVKTQLRKSKERISDSKVKENFKPTESKKRETRKKLFTDDKCSAVTVEKAVTDNSATNNTKDLVIQEKPASATAEKKSRKRAISEDSNKSDATPLKKKKRDFDVESINSGSKRRRCHKSADLEIETSLASEESLVLKIRRKVAAILSPDRPKSQRKQLEFNETSSPLTPLKKQIKGTPKSKDKETKDAPTTPVTKMIKKFETPRTPLEEARVSLHVAAVPRSLPCREAEYKNILNFVENKIIDGVGGCMYISGVPGTGKTATVTQVIRHLQANSDKSALPSFNYIEINGMRLSDPRQAYVQLYQRIFRKHDRISSDLAYKKLDSYFNKADKKKIMTVVLVDELDLMCNRKQDVVYNLLDWPSKPHSRLVVLTIANTMDMPERKLKGRVNSRLGLTRLTFLPYTHKQLEEIVMARLQGTDAFVVDAVRLATRKVAAVSGDARRALDICRRAAELPCGDEPVRIAHIEQAIKEMTNSNIVRLIRSCSEVEKNFLRAVSDVCVRTGLEEVDLLRVIDHLLPLCVLEGLKRPSVPDVLGVCQRLKSFRLLFTSNHGLGLLQRLTLNVTQDDLHYALKVEN